MQRQVNAPMKFLDKWSGHLLGRALGGVARALGRFGSPRLAAAPGQILIIKFCCMGDAVLVLPSLRALRARFPGAKITMLCTPRTIAIFKDCADLDEVLLFQLTGSRGIGEFLTTGLASLFRTMGSLRTRRFDLVVDFDNYYNWTTFVGFATGAPTRVGFDPPGQGRRFLLTNPVPYAGDRHMVEFYLDLPRAIGADTDNKSIALPLAPDDAAWAAAYLDEHGLKRDGKPVVILSPGRSEAWHFIRWAEENFVAAAVALHRTHGAHVLLMGGSAEAAIAERIVSGLAAHQVPAINTVGQTSLKQSEALLQRADLLICNDSGPMHLGAAMGVPTLAVFGPANPARWGPYGPEHRVARLDIDCSPCLFMGRLDKCPRQLLECLHVPVEDVVRVADEMLARRRGA
jgi:heptosyltransferase II